MSELSSKDKLKLLTDQKNKEYKESYLKNKESKIGNNTNPFVNTKAVANTNPGGNTNPVANTNPGVNTKVVNTNPDVNTKVVNTNPDDTNKTYSLLTYKPLCTNSSGNTDMFSYNPPAIKLTNRDDELKELLSKCSDKFREQLIQYKSQLDLIDSGEKKDKKDKKHNSNIIKGKDEGEDIFKPELMYEGLLKLPDNSINQNVNFSGTAINQNYLDEFKIKNKIPGFLHQVNVEKILALTPSQVNRNSIKNVMSNQEELLNRSLDSFTDPNDIQLQKRIIVVILLQYLYNNINKRISYFKVQNELYQNKFFAKNKKKNFSIDVDTWTGDKVKVEIYIYNYEYEYKLPISSDYQNVLNTIFGEEESEEKNKFIPSKAVVGEIGNDPILKSKSLNIGPPKGSVNYIPDTNFNVLYDAVNNSANPANPANPDEKLDLSNIKINEPPINEEIRLVTRLLTQAAKDETDEEADIQIDFETVTSAFGSEPNLTFVNPENDKSEINVTGPQRFDGIVNIPSINAQINYKCVLLNKGFTKPVYCFFIPLTQVQYENLKKVVKARAQQFKTIKVNAPVNIYDTNEPKYQERTQFFMNKYLKYKKKYLDLKNIL